MPYIDKLPTYIRDILFSSAFSNLIDSLSAALNFSAEQRGMLEDSIGDIFEKTIKPEELSAVFQSQFNITAEQADMLERTFFINLVLPFTDFFGNHAEYFQKKYGDPEKALEESKTMSLLLKIINDTLREKADEIDELDANREKEAIDMAALFQKSLICHFYAPDDPYKVSLNNTIIFLISNVEGFVDTLLKVLYANEEHIGKETMQLGDKDGLPPTVGNWIQDLLGFSGGVASSIKIAQYMTDNVNAKKLLANDKEALRRLFETFSVLKNFPESFEKMSPEHWMVIPYHLAEEEAKTARELPAVPGGNKQELGIMNQEQAPLAEIRKATGSLPVVEMAATDAGSVPAQAGIKLGMTIAQAGSLPAVEMAVANTLIDYDRVISHILEVADLKFSDDVTSRVKAILSSRIRNVRNSIDTGERLKAPLTEGGAGLSLENTDKLLKEANTAAQAVMTGTVDVYAPVKIEKQASGITNQDSKTDGIAAVAMPPRNDMLVATGSRITSGMTDTAEPDPVSVPPLTPNPSTLTPVPTMVIKEVDGVPMLVEKKNGNGKKKDVPVATVSLPLVEMTTEKTIDTAKPSVETIQVEAPVQKQELGITNQEEVQSKIAETGSRITSGMTESPPLAPNPSTLTPSISIPVQVRAVPTSGQVKKPVADVKAPPRLVGVVDEIRALTIKDFRRLSQDPQEAAKRILQKIQQLEKESLTKKADAIKAWKENDVYMLYLEIGQINIGVDMNKLIEERKAAGKEYLTSEEFDALLDLSEKLRF